MIPPAPILVTGATGFIGSHLARRLAGLGSGVHVFVRPTSDLRRLQGPADRIARHPADLEDPDSVRRAVREIRPRTVFHCAAYGGHPTQKDPNRAFRTNLAGTVHLLAACAEAGLGRFLHAGSSSEYGMKSAPMSEEDAADPVDAYGASKAGATLWCRAAAASGGLSTVTLRLFSPYGPMDDPTRLIPTVIRAFLNRDSPRLASPEAARDFVFIDDVVDACLLAATAPAAVGEIVNIGSGRQVTVGETVETIARLLPGAPPPAWGSVPARPGSAAWQADIGKARRLLGWNPNVPLEEGLRRTIEWTRNEAF